MASKPHAPLAPPAAFPYKCSMRRSILIAIFFLAIHMTAAADDLTYTDFNAADYLNADKDTIASRTSSVREYGIAELRALGATNLADALTMIAEGYVCTGDRFTVRQETYLQLRGGDIRSVVILIDGVPVNDAIYQTTDLTRFPINEISRIRVSAGPASLRYGPGGSGGVVEVITRQAADKFTAEFGTDWGAGRALQYDLWLGDTQGQLNYFGAASHDEQAGYFLPDDFESVPDEDGGLRENSFSKINNFLGRTGLIFNVPVQFFIGGSYEEDEKDIPRPLNSPNDIAYRYAHRRRSMGSFHFLAEPGDLLEIRGLAYITENASRFERWLDKWAINDLDAQYHRKDLRIGAALMPTLDFGPYSRVRLTAHYISDETRHWRQGETQSKGEYETIHAAIEDDVRIGKYLGLSAGVGYELMRPHKFDGVEDGELDDFNAATYRAGLAAEPFIKTFIHLAYAQNVRFPSPYELYWGDDANPKLDPEITGKLELGVSREFGEILSLSLTGFHDETKDAIAEPGEFPSAGMKRSENFGDKTVDGATLLIETNPLEGLFARADYTYLKSEFDPKDTVKNREYDEIFFVPEHLFHGVASYLSTIGVGGALEFTYTGERIDYESRDSGKLPHYGLASARLFYNYRDNLEFSVACDNLTDEYYEITRHYPALGRYFHGGLRIMF